jgi:flagellar FliL protein
MAEEKKDDSGAAEAAPKKKPPLALLLLIGNTVLSLVAAGVFVYTKVLYKKPKITEEEELSKKSSEVIKPKLVQEKSIVSLDSMSVNIATTSGKSHYATLQVGIECTDSEAAGLVSAKKALFIDKIIVVMAKKQLTELNTIQGKLLLKSILLREFNSLLDTPGAITNIYFPNYILQ